VAEEFETSGLTQREFAGHRGAAPEHVAVVGPPSQAPGQRRGRASHALTTGAGEQRARPVTDRRLASEPGWARRFSPACEDLVRMVAVEVLNVRISSSQHSSFIPEIPPAILLCVYKTR